MDTAARCPAPDRSGGRATGLAVLGGTFDPPHSTHVALAAAAMAQLSIERVLVIPAADHPHKQGRNVTSAPHRVAMCKLAFAELPCVQVDDRELRRGGISFTVDTLAELRREFPRQRLHFLIGSDNLPLLPTWRHHHQLLELATVVTYPRAGHAIDRAQLHGLDLTEEERRALLTNVLQVQADAVNSSALRAQLRAGERDLAAIAPAVLAYIDAHGLYRAQ